MSLLCGESEDCIWENEKAFGVSHPLGPGYAVSEIAIEKIPQSERRPHPCQEFEEGLNIREGEGIKSSRTWQFSTFKTGKFLFSISEAAAKAYLPRTWARIAKAITRGAH